MRVFVTDISHVDEKELARLYSTLPPFRKASADRCSKLSYPQHVVSFCLVRYALKVIAPDAATEQWVIGFRGKPQLAAETLHFNLAHTANAVAVAVSASDEVGVDIEEIKPHSGGFAARFFSAAEQLAVSRSPDPVSELCRIWSAKEAEAKRRGDGLSGGIAQIPTAHVQSIAVTAGGKRHWLSATPAWNTAELQWIALNELQ